LHQNYPNPFNPTTTIRYELPKASIVTLSVFDILGREVSVLVNERRDAGSHEVNFCARNLASGVYLCRMQAGDFVQLRKLLLVQWAPSKLFLILSGAEGGRSPPSPDHGSNSGSHVARSRHGVGNGFMSSGSTM
jgi:hypothetical protein